MSDTEHEGSLAPGFHSLEVLHRGATSTVYRALPDGGGGPVALKVMRDGDGEAEVEKLRDLSGLPGTVEVLGHGLTSSGRAFVAMEYHANGDYGAELRRRHPLPVDEVLRAGRGVAAALKAVHARGLLHHGVEPANLLRSEDGAVLTDAGAVLSADELPARVGPDPRVVVHTPPEVLLGEEVSAASDVYRLATTLWVLLAGHPPFAEGPETVVDPFDYRERVLGTDPPRLPRADLPGDLRAVLQRALSRDPGQRHPSAAEFAAALEGIGARTGEEEPSPGLSVPEPSVPEGSGPELPEAEGAVPEQSVSVPSVPGTPSVPEAPGAEPLPEPSGPLTGAAGATGPDPTTGPAPTCGSRPEPPGWNPPPASPPDGTPGRSPSAVPTSEDVVNSLRDVAGGRVPERPEDAWAGLQGWTNLPARDVIPPGQDVPHGRGTPSRHGASRVPSPKGAAPPVPVPTAPAPPEAPSLRPTTQPARQRPLYVAVAVAAVALVAVAVGAVAVLRPGAGGELLDRVGASGEDPSPSTPEEDPGGPPAPPAGIAEDAVPSDVVLEDLGDSVVLSWTDNSGGVASHHVIGGPAGSAFTNLADVVPGAVEARVSGFDPAQEYCFAVVAVLSVDEIATSEETCTDRAGAR